MGWASSPPSSAVSGRPDRVRRREPAPGDSPSDLPDRQPGEPPLRFPGYDVLDQQSHWDARTRQVVLARLAPSRTASFFSPGEEPVCRALLDRLLANDDPETKVPVFELVDQRLAEGSTDGWRYDDMPPDAEAWRRSLAELIERGFADRSPEEQVDALDGIRDEKSFAGMPASRVFDLWLRYACTAYYSHPWAWSEIGFGGPAYPRGYRNIGVGRREPWEVAEAGSEDPMPWIQRVEAARRRQRSGTGRPR
ncbi:MAG TPA: gluconate 2-dehydrogenase subunit 3 family protein [Actinomycetota bacterium]|nr:gluconate 2-dehydrogenase subunit 3 family protein [Actinomycetota bacterium]